MAEESWIVEMLLEENYDISGRDQDYEQLVIFHLEKGPFYEEFYQCVTYGFYTEAWQEQLYTTFSLVCMFLLPLAILVSTYVCTITTIARSEKLFRAEVSSDRRYVASDINRRRLIHRAKMKSLRISVVIVLAFIVWWTPYYSMMIIFMFLNPDKHLSEDLQSGIFFFGMSNSLVNPVIYGAFHLWQPHDKRRESTNSDYRHRDTSGLQRHSTMVVHRASARILRARDEETSFVLLDDLGGERCRMSSSAVQQYKSTALTNGHTAV